MEGVVFQLKRIMEVMEEKEITGKRIKMVRGASKSRIWPKIISDVTGMDILIPRVMDEDFATKGAAILAGIGANIFSSFEEGYSKLNNGFNVISPGENAKFYQNKYKLFLENYLSP